MEGKLSEKLILRMSSQTNKAIPWLVWSDNNNEVIMSGEIAGQHELSSITQYAKGRQVTVVANSADVRLITHQLELKPNRQLLNALPFMLEDELAEDIDKLHFTVESTGFDKTTQKHFANVAIISKRVLASWLDVLTSNDISIVKVIPEVLCLPVIDWQTQNHADTSEEAESEDSNSSPQKVQIMALADGFLCREGQWQGAFVEQAWLSLYLQQKTDTEFLSYTPAPNELVTAAAEPERGIKLTPQDPELPMLILAKGANQQKWNLLQGEFAPKKQISKTWLLWRPVVVLGVFLLIISFVLKIANWQQKEHQLQVAKAELAEAYKSAFPKEKLRINLLRRQLQNKVKALGSSAGGSQFDFLPVMEKLTPIFKRYEKVSVENIRFDGKRSELRLEVMAPSFQEFERYRVALSELGFDVKQGAVKNEGDVVTGSFSIQGGQ